MAKNRVLVALVISAMFYYSCSQNNGSNSEVGKTTGSNTATTDKGIGSYQNVQLSHPLNQEMVAAGKNIYEVKCLACHKLTTEKLVGPGWKGVTDRRTPEYVLNFVTNTDEMLNKDPNAKELLESCMVRMPNQHLTDAEARSAFEFMRFNDGKN